MKRILIIDDASTVRSYHRQILEHAHFSVEEAINGFEALEKCWLTPFDLLLVDLNMPTMDGLAFLRELRSQPQLHQAPAVIVSTESMQKMQWQILVAGANFSLTKPVKPALLIALTCLLTGSHYEPIAEPVLS